jgi:hypothetical protein
MQCIIRNKREKKYYDNLNVLLLIGAYPNFDYLCSPTGLKLALIMYHEVGHFVPYVLVTVPLKGVVSFCIL